MEAKIMDIYTQFKSLKTVDILSKIGYMVIDSNGPYQDLVDSKIKLTGKNINDLTVQELLDIEKICNKEFNS